MRLHLRAPAGVRARAGVLTAAVAMVLLVTGSPAGAAAPPQAATPIGGARLGSAGLVVDPLPGAHPLPRRISASGWLLADLDTGAVLAARDPHGRFLPASTLKILTAVTLIPRLDPDKSVLISNADAAVDGTKVGVVPHTRYRVHDLFNAMLIMSANDAAVALADAYGGLPRTLAAMNAEARYLQADDTLARTPDGLDARGQVSSAYDLALLAKAGLAIPAFRQYVATRQVSFPAPHHKHYQVSTHNRLLVNYRGAIGVKNGYTVAAHASFVGAATRGGHTLVVTMLHADPACWHEAAQLLDWGFADLDRVRPVGTLVGPAPAAGGHTGSVAAAAATETRAGGGTAGPARTTHPATTSSADVAAPAGAAAGVAIVGLGVLRARRRRRPARRRPLTVPRT